MEDPTLDSLIRQLLEWVAARPRTYEEVMDAWRTSCPKLPVWEEANERGFIQEQDGNISLTPSGYRLLQSAAATAAARTLGKN